jgi:hypothetical protein
MQLKSLRISYKFLQSKFYIITLSMVLLSSTFILDPQLDAFAQQQQDTGSLVNSICQLVQDNSLISTLVGLDQALNICNNLNSIGSNQALSELCSTIGGLNVINIDAYCNQQQISNQTQHVSENNGTSNSQGSTNNNQGNPQNPSSNSIVDRILGLLFGFLKF